MDWRIKCLAFQIFAHMPFGSTAYRYFQRHVTGNYLLDVTDDRLATYQFHVNNYLALQTRESVLEFGSGSNLLLPLLLHHHDAPKIYTYDIDRIATVERVNHVIKQLASRLPGAWPLIDNLEKDLIHKYRVFYRAPADASRTGLAPNSIGFVCSTSVLEHIPISDINEILREAIRISSATARMSHIIGYSDHYSHSDPSISHFNFYRYGDFPWSLFNPHNHFQNRLRHCDFERIFENLSLSILINQRASYNSALPERMAERFKQYAKEDLLTYDGHFVLNPIPSGDVQF